MRFAATQAWPLFLNLAAISPLIASSRSALSKMINGALPPNSIEVRLTVSAHCLSNWLPTPVEPVKVNLRTICESVSILPTVFASCDTSTLNAPLTKPAWSARYANAIAHSGVCSEGFNIKLQPAA